MISKMQLYTFRNKFKSIYKEWKTQDIILRNGLHDYDFIISIIFPFIVTFGIMLFSYAVDLSIKKTLQNIIAIMPSLIGFLIASATIIISINNEKLNDKPPHAKYSYKQIGGAIFFNATKIAFILLIIAFLCPNTFPQSIFYIKPYILPFIQFFIYWLFSKFIIMVLYGLMHLTASIEAEEGKKP
jgi:hypothetical protein